MVQVERQGRERQHYKNNNTSTTINLPFVESMNNNREKKHATELNVSYFKVIISLTKPAITCNSNVPLLLTIHIYTKLPPYSCLP